jgi:hypothetical protein
MGEAARATATQHEADAVPAGEPPEAGDVVGRTVPQVDHLIGPELVEQRHRVPWSPGTWRMRESEHHGDVFEACDLGEHGGDACSFTLVRRCRGHDHEAIGVPDRSARPGRDVAVGLQHDVVVGDVGLVQELDEARHADVVDRDL